ncbi:NAD-dependent epimerase/dehydratase family protein [Candidatus Cryosericum hinesii]|uniref:NAD-dependent epimerase/dehydratase family protein n=3 Tax=Candidatus Cryosericaceae TaxID=2498708 RepID=A0A398DE51_9BACT|nr:NAD-dependent epimerase/dehydratase family protein [Candidatus Cryosericum odellii]RIE08317.1 NAD-dependent epimerase/dehydratase family protein [Candidatus Cryosericum hinesii]RIE11890.1 NAD-dependent epimerase/dehydratase family protein [Candidatus Cryosericum hinesii]RIE11959.1 NAD-dependent epimerase/dehydratase family protein [Candidatus Cryosericum hinesii]
MNAMVVGGAGFIGSHIVDALAARGCTATVFDDLSSGKRDNVEAGIALTVGDVRDKQAVGTAVSGSVDYVFHLAAQIDVRRAVRDPGLDAQVNVGGTINVLNACVQAHVRRFVMSSTGGALYGEPSTLPAGEQSVIQPLSPYGVSKYCAEQYIGYFHRVCGLETVILRYANVYGPRQDPTGEGGVVGIFARHILLGQSCIVYGDGEQTRDFVFVDDVAQANMLAMRGPLDTLNIGTGVETSLNQLLAAFERVVGHPVAREYAPARAGEVRRIALNAEKARHELGWKPSVSLADGLARTLAWVRTCL